MTVTQSRHFPPLDKCQVGIFYQISYQAYQREACIQQWTYTGCCGYGVVVHWLHIIQIKSLHRSVNKIIENVVRNKSYACAKPCDCVGPGDLSHISRLLVV